MQRIFTGTESGLVLSHKHIGRDQRRNRKPVTTTGSCGLWSAGETLWNHHVGRTYIEILTWPGCISALTPTTKHRNSSWIKNQREKSCSIDTQWGFIINVLKILIIFNIPVYWHFYGCCITLSYRQMAFITWTYALGSSAYKISKKEKHPLFCL